MYEIGYKGRKFPLRWDIYAHDEILKSCADAGYQSPGEWMSGEKLKSYGIILYELICGGIRAHNFDISLGLCGGKKMEFPAVEREKREDVLSLLRACDISKAETIINLCWTAASHAEMPDELKALMPDDDYLEIAAEIEKDKPESEKN